MNTKTTQLTLTLEMINGQLPINEYNCPPDEITNVLLVTKDLKLVAVGEQNLAGGRCECCGSALPEHVGYIDLRNFALTIPLVGGSVTLSGDTI